MLGGELAVLQAPMLDGLGAPWAFLQRKRCSQATAVQGMSSPTLFAG
jgi:hypothetical protein